MSCRSCGCPGIWISLEHGNAFEGDEATVKGGIDSSPNRTRRDGYPGMLAGIKSLTEHCIPSSSIPSFPQSESMLVPEVRVFILERMSVFCESMRSSPG